MKTDESSSENTSNESIKTIFVTPKTHQRWKYIVNDGFIHISNRDSLQKFLIELVPSQTKKIIEYMSEFQMFLLDTEEKNITRFYLDQEEVQKTLRNKFQKNTRNYEYKKSKEIQEEKNKRPFDRELQNVLKRFIH